MRKRLDDKVLGTNTFVNRDQPRWDFHIQKNLEAAAEEIAASATQSDQPETRVQGGVSGADLVAQGQVPFEDAESSLNALFGLFPELQPVNPDATGQVDLSELGAIHDAAEVLLASESMPLVGGVVDDDLNGTNDAHLASPFYDVVAIGPGSDDASELFEVPLRLNDLSAEDVPTVLAARLDAAEIWDIDGLDLFEQLVQPLMSTAIVEAVVREEEGIRSVVLQISDTLETAEGAQRKPMMEIELSDDGRVAVTSSLDEVRPSATPLVTSLEVSDGLDQLAARVTEELGRFAGFYSFELRVGVAELPEALSAKYSDAAHAFYINEDESITVVDRETGDRHLYNDEGGALYSVGGEDVDQYQRLVLSRLTTADDRKTILEALDRLPESQRYFSTEHGPGFAVRAGGAEMLVTVGDSGISVSSVVDDAFRVGLNVYNDVGAPFSGVLSADALRSRLDEAIDEQHGLNIDGQEEELEAVSDHVLATARDVFSGFADVHLAAFTNSNGHTVVLNRRTQQRLVIDDEGQPLHIADAAEIVSRVLVIDTRPENLVPLLADGVSIQHLDQGRVDFWDIDGQTLSTVNGAVMMPDQTMYNVRGPFSLGDDAMFIVNGMTVDIDTAERNRSRHQLLTGRTVYGIYNSPDHAVAGNGAASKVAETVGATEDAFNIRGPMIDESAVTTFNSMWGSWLAGDRNITYVAHSNGGAFLTQAMFHFIEEVARTDFAAAYAENEENARGLAAAAIHARGFRTTSTGPGMMEAASRHERNVVFLNRSDFITGPATSAVAVAGGHMGQSRTGDEGYQIFFDIGGDDQGHQWLTNYGLVYGVVAAKTGNFGDLEALGEPGTYIVSLTRRGRPNEGLTFTRVANPNDAFRRRVDAPSIQTIRNAFTLSDAAEVPVVIAEPR
ncbi:MAG: hypothetical protein AAFN74_15920 [Myxococcota bacterium]